LQLKLQTIYSKLGNHYAPNSAFLNLQLNFKPSHWAKPTLPRLTTKFGTFLSLNATKITNKSESVAGLGN
jgi:hypothetical protein